MSQTDPRDRDEALAEALRQLELSPRGVRAMLDHVHRFCQQHGPRHYAELLELVSECDALLGTERDGGDGGQR